MAKPSNWSKFIILVLALTVLPSQAAEILVFDAQGKLLRRLMKSAEVKRFQQLWQQKQAVALFAKPNWDYQIQIKASQQTPQRWWYAADGHAQRADNEANTPYRLAQFEKLNTLLGIQPATPE